MNKQEFTKFKANALRDLKNVTIESNKKSLYAVNVVSKESVTILNSLNRIESEMGWNDLPF